MLWFWLSGSQRYCGQCAAMIFDNFWRSLSDYPHIKLWTYWQIGNSSTSQVHILYRTFPCCILPFLREDSPYPKMRPHSDTSKKSFLREPIRLKRDDLTICIRIIGQNAKPSQRKQPLQYASTWWLHWLSKIAHCRWSFVLAQQGHAAPFWSTLRL